MTADAPAAPPRPSWTGDARLATRQLRFEQLSFWRNRVGALFTVGFAVVFLVLLGATAGSGRIDFLGNIRVIQYYVPGFAAYGVMAACFNALALGIVARRETGLLKRLRLSPLPAWVYMAGLVANALVVSLIQVVLLLAIGRLGYHVHLPYAWAPFIVVMIVGAMSFAALGIAVSTFIPNAEAGGPVMGVIFYVLLFLSGLWYPLRSGSVLASVSTLFPVRGFIVAAFLTFDPHHATSAWAWHDIAVMLAWGIAGLVLALRRFRWEPQRR